MAAVSDFTPLRYRPTDPNMGRWGWQQDPERPDTHLLTERDRDPVALIARQPDNTWRIALTPESQPWLHTATPKDAKKAAAALETNHPYPAAAAEAAERTLATLAIAAGVSPDPAHIPIMFMLGKTRSSLNYLQDLEELAQEYIEDRYVRGTLAKSEGASAAPSPNKVAQARVLHSMFKMPKGHWPPRTDVIDDCLYLDSRYAPERIKRSRTLAFQPRSAAQPALLWPEPTPNTTGPCPTSQYRQETSDAHNPGAPW